MKFFLSEYQQLTNSPRASVPLNARKKGLSKKSASKIWKYEILVLMLIKHRRGGHTPNSRKTINQKTNNKTSKEKQTASARNKQPFLLETFF